MILILLLPKIAFYLLLFACGLSLQMALGRVSKVVGSGFFVPRFPQTELGPNFTFSNIHLIYVPYYRRRF